MDLDQLKKYSFLEAAQKRGAFSGGAGSSYESNNVVYVGLGKKLGSIEALRRAIGTANVLILQKKIAAVKVNVKSFPMNEKLVGRAAMEALFIGTHLHVKYKSKPNPTPIKHIIFTSKSKLIQEGVKIGRAMAEVQCLVMDLANEPSNELQPDTFAKCIQVHGKKMGLKVKVLHEHQVEFLGVEDSFRQTPVLILIKIIFAKTNNML